LDELKTIGRHLIAEFYGCCEQLLDDKEAVRGFMLQAAEVIGATVVGEVFHKFSPQGVSGSVVIAESHLSVHTWPETGYVAVDIYTCGGLDPRLGFEALAASLEASSGRVQEIVRGLPDEVDDHHTWLPEDVQVITRTRALDLGAAAS
jgi:S-adenosylmethionine decarboxylase